MLTPQLDKQRRQKTFIGSIQSKWKNASLSLEELSFKSMAIALSTILLLGAFGTLLILFVSLQHPQTNNGRELSAADWDGLGRYRGVSLRAGPYNLAEVAELQTHLDQTSAHDINQQLMFLKQIGPLSNRQQQLEQLLQDNYDRRLQMEEASTFAPSPMPQPLPHSPRQSQQASLLSALQITETQFKDAELKFAHAQVPHASSLVMNAQFINQQALSFNLQCPGLTLTEDNLASIQRAQYYLMHLDDVKIMHAAAKVYHSEQAHKKSYINFQIAQNLYVDTTPPGKSHEFGSAQHQNLINAARLWAYEANEHYRHKQRLRQAYPQGAQKFNDSAIRDIVDYARSKLEVAEKSPNKFLSTQTNIPRKSFEALVRHKVQAISAKARYKKTNIGVV